MLSPIPHDRRSSQLFFVMPSASSTRDGASRVEQGEVSWFVLGYLMYAMALAAVAVLVSRPEDVAYVTAPVTLGLAFSYLLMFVGLSDPRTRSSWPSRSFRRSHRSSRLECVKMYILRA